MTRLEDALQGVGILGFDTPPVIYFIEANPRYDAVVTEVFARIHQGSLEGITSAVTLAEVLVMPIRRNQLSLRDSYSDLLLNSAHFQTASITPEITERTADLRARYKIRTPDAFQLAVAWAAGCDAFLTNDAALARIKELRVLILDDLEL